MQPGTKVLIAEDDPNSARLITDYLTAKGALVTWKDNGSEALKEVQSESYDLLILDLRLPEKNGFVVAGEIRDDERLFNLPIIVTSAFPDEQNLLRSYQLGVDAFLSKPVDLKKLFLLAKNLTSRKQKNENKIKEALVLLNEYCEKKLNRPGHAVRVEKNCLSLAAAYQLEDHLATLRAAALLHDLGLIFTSSDLEHGPVGAEIAQMFGVKAEIAYLIENHHGNISQTTKIDSEEVLESYLGILKIAEKIEETYRNSISSFEQDKEKGLLTPDVASVIAELIMTT